MQKQIILATTLFMLAVNPALAGEGLKTSNETVSLLLDETYKTRDISGDVHGFLSKHLTIESDTKTTTLHMFALRGGEIIARFPDDQEMLRKRPGRAKFAEDDEKMGRKRPGKVKHAIPEPSFFEGLLIKDFIVQKVETGSAEKTLSQTAAELMKRSGYQDGIAVVVTWDDMLEDEAPLALVGFGSWS